MRSHLRKDIGRYDEKDETGFRGYSGRAAPRRPVAANGFFSCRYPVKPRSSDRGGWYQSGRNRHRLVRAGTNLRSVWSQIRFASNRADGTGKKVTVNDNGNLTDTTGFFHYAATLTGEGKVNYGSFIDSIHFVLQAMPESVDTQFSHITNDGHAEVVSHLILGFSDNGIVASNTLPVGHR